MSNKLSKIEYYNVTLEKALNLLTDSDRCTRMFAEGLFELLSKYKTIDRWSDSPIPDYMDAYLNAKVLKEFIEKKLNEPDEKTIQFAIKNKLKGMLITKGELALLQNLVNNFEETKEYLNKKYGFSTLLN